MARPRLHKREIEQRQGGEARGMSLVVSAGGYGGFSFRVRPRVVRLCLGWVVVCLLAYDLDHKVGRLGAALVEGAQR